MLDLVAAREGCSVRDAAVRVAEWFNVETSRPERKARPAAKQTKSREKAPAEEAGGVPPPEAGKEPKMESETEAPVPASADADPAPCASATPVPNPPLTFELKLDPEHPWFAEAGIRPETVGEFGLGFCAKGVMGGRIAFPIRKANGELVGYAGRWPGDKPPKGQPLWRYPAGLDLSQVVYPAERLAGADLSKALLASDPLRVVLCWQLGVGEVFFVPSASSLEDAMLAFQRTMA